MALTNRASNKNYVELIGGSWTPTFRNLVNLGTVTATRAYWEKTGNLVRGIVVGAINPTTGSDTTTSWEFEIPYSDFQARAGSPLSDAVSGGGSFFNNAVNPGNTRRIIVDRTIQTGSGKHWLLCKCQASSSVNVVYELSFTILV
jgi:hypothetical protein